MTLSMPRSLAMTHGWPVKNVSWSRRG